MQISRSQGLPGSSQGDSKRPRRLISCITTDGKIRPSTGTAHISCGDTQADIPTVLPDSAVSHPIELLRMAVSGKKWHLAEKTPIFCHRNQ